MLGELEFYAKVWGLITRIILNTNIFNMVFFGLFNTIF